MKNNFKKVMGAMIASSMLLSIMQTAFAATAFESDFSANQGTMELVNASAFSGYTYEQSYVEGVAGKMAGDMAYKATVADLPYSFSGESGFLIPFYQGIHMVSGLPSVATMEMSIKAPEVGETVVLKSMTEGWNGYFRKWYHFHEFVKIDNGKVYVHNGAGASDSKADIDTGITVKSGEWVRIAVETYSDGSDLKVYVNGKATPATVGGSFYGYWWTQLASVIKSSATEGARYVDVVVDDVKIYDGVYDNTNAVASYSVDSDKYFEGINTFFVNASDNLTAGDILQTVTADNKYVINSLDGNTVLNDTDKVSDGNVVVIKSADEKTFEYLYICTDPEHKIKDTCSFSNGENYRMFGDTVYAGRTTATGMFTKGAGDISDDMYVKDLPAATESANRYNFMYDTTGLCDVPSFTREFSIAADGDVDEFRFIMNSKYGDGTMQYQEPIIFYDNGTIEANHDRILDTVFKKKQWYRVAVTVYPQSATYDLYLNNELVVESGFLSMQADHQGTGYNITNIDWFQIQPFYYAQEGSEAIRSGHVYVDDTVTYYGTYNANAKNEAILLTDMYKVDEAKGTIVIEEGLDVSTFAENVGDGFGTAIPAVYTDNTYSEALEDRFEEGNVIVLMSENGFVYKYYTVKYPRFEYDESIKLYVNDVKTTTLEKGKVKAEISAFAPVSAPEYGDLIIAVYKNNELQAVKMDSKAISGNVDFSVDVDIADTEGVSVKAMFWKLSDLRPYLPPVEAE